MDLKRMKKHKANLDDIYHRTQEACKTNNLKEIQEILLTNCYPKLTQEEKEELLLNSANVALVYSKCGQDILRYLILDYGIKEYSSFIIYRTDETEKLLAQRKLNKSLNSNLKVNSNTSKKLKV